MNDNDRDHLIKNLIGHMQGVRRDIQERSIKVFLKVDPDYGSRIAKGLGIPIERARL